jgi:hypothetical protein
LESVVQEVSGDYAKEAAKSWETMLNIYLLENASVEPMVTLVANDNWMEFTLRYVVDFKARRLTKNQLFTRILDEFGKTDGEVSFASATFQLVEAPKLDVRLSNSQDLPDESKRS